jgi:hypothetical protein
VVVRLLHRLARRAPAAAILCTLLALLVVNAPAGAVTRAAAPQLPDLGAEPSGAPATAPASGRRYVGGALLPTKRVAAPKPAKRVLASLPSSVALWDYAVPVQDRGQIKSCVAWTIAYAMLGWYSRHENTAGQPFHPMYMYSQTHLDDSPDGGGSRMAEAMDLVLAEGNDTMAHYGHDLTDFQTPPTAAETANAAYFKIASPLRLFADANGGGYNGQVALQTALSNGKPVAIALRIRPGFRNMPNTSATYDDDIGGAIDGSHAVLAVGYDQYGVWIQNSWGTDWGYYGYGRISWRVVQNDVFEAYTISGFAPSSVDTTRPAVDRPEHRLALGTITGTPAAAMVPVEVSWSARDASGIKQFLVHVKKDAGTPMQQTLSSATATSKRLFVESGHSYTVFVQAQDGAGNWALDYMRDTFTVTTIDDASWSVGWSRYPFYDAFGGSYSASSTAGDWFQYSERAADIGLIAVKFNGAGQPTVSFDGVDDGTLDLSAPSAQGRQLVYWAHFTDPSVRHTVSLVVGGGWTTIDGVVLLQ